MTLKDQFHEAMLTLYDRAKNECDYKATRFLGMILKYGGFNTAKILLAPEDTPPGLIALHKLNRLDLSVEALVLKTPFWQLFTEDERLVAKNRLHKFNYHGQSSLPNKE